MADLFEEYGALEYKKPKKKLKLPKLPVPPKWILWLVIAAVAIGAVALVCWLTRDAPFWMTEEERTAQTLEKCEKALTEFQTLDSRYVHWEIPTYGTSGKAYFSHDHWRCGEDIYLISTLGDALSEGHLRKGDEQYYFGAAQMWETRTFEDGYLDILWLDTYSWNEEDITLLSQKTAGAGEEITLQIEGPVDPDKRAFRDMENYTVCMRLDEAGTLTAVTLSYTIRNYEETQTYQINAISREEVSQTIEMAYADVVDQIAQKQNPMLEKCRRALEELRSLDGYCVERKQNSGGQILYGNSKIWRYGSDLLVLGTDTTDGYLCKNGDQFYLSPQREEGQRVWTAAKLADDLLVIPWLETYNWDSKDVISASEDNHFICIVFEGDPFYGADGDIERYSVVFTLDDSGALTAVDMAYPEADGGVHSSTFKIVSTDAQEIAQTIDEAYEEAVLHVKVG